MAILNNNPLIGASGNQGGYNINNSLRFRSSASAYLSRTPASTSGNQIFTASFWIKRGTLGVSQNVFYSFNNTNNADTLYFPSSDAFGIAFYTSGAYSIELVTTQVFRDPSAWYHIVVAIDTTQATASNRAKLYVNGNQVTAFSTATYPTQNATFTFNTNVAHVIGASNYVSLSGYIDGYLAEVNWITGQALTPSSFGETDTTTGVWKPKAYTGTYGTNGFYLKFSDIATTSGSNAGLGKDFSGNTNYWTTNNISVTSGTTYDAMTDVPTNTSATVANYCVVSPLAYRTTTPTPTITNGNLTVVCPSGAASSIGSSTFGVSSGKWYWEVTKTGTAYANLGVALSPFSQTVSSAFDFGYASNEYAYVYSGNKYNNNSSSAYGASYTDGDVIGVALDLDNGTLTFYKNNVSQGTAYSSLPSGTYIVGCYDSYNGSGFQFNFGQRPFNYSAPSGFLPLNTYNLPTPTILQGNKYMDATLYTGTGTALNVVNAGQFKPDFVWAKNRSAADSSGLYDSVRGVNQRLISNLTNAEDTSSGVSAFNSNGFSLGTAANYNTSGNNFVAWQWQAGQGSTSSNTAGSITSTVSVNTTAGFSVVTYTGNGTIGATVGHGLGVAPSMIIVKQRNSTESWATYHKSLGATQYLNLNQTMAAATSITRWNNTTPSSTVITFYNDAVSNGSGSTYVAYCWAEIAGFSRFTSYTGNGSTDGPFIFTNFRPKFIMLKRTDSTGSWSMYDATRNTYNAGSFPLFANLSDAESASTDHFDWLSNGFKMKSTNQNASGGTYIVMAFSSNPFKNSNAV